MGNNLKNQHYKNMGIMPEMDTLTFEAESVAFVVCKYLSLDTDDYSFPYILSWSGDEFKDILKESLSEIQKIADKIIQDYVTYNKKK